MAVQGPLPSSQLKSMRSSQRTMSVRRPGYQSRVFPFQRSRSQDREPPASRRPCFGIQGREIQRMLAGDPGPGRTVSPTEYLYFVAALIGEPAFGQRREGGPEAVLHPPGFDSV